MAGLSLHSGCGKRAALLRGHCHRRGSLPSGLVHPQCHSGARCVRVAGLAEGTGQCTCMVQGETSCPMCCVFEAYLPTCIL